MTRRTLLGLAAGALCLWPATTAVAARNGVIAAEARSEDCSGATGLGFPAVVADVPCNVETKAIVVTGAGGGGAWKLPLPADSVGVRFSSDGRLVAFVPPGSGLAIATAAGGAPRVIEHGGVYPGNFAWSPAGVSLAYVLDNHTSSLVGFNPATGVRRRLATGRSPAWSPSGDRLAFLRGSLSDPAVPVRVLVMRSGGSGVRLVKQFGARMLQELTDLALTGWSADARSIICERETDSGKTLRSAIDVRTGAMRRLGPARPGLVSPDGRLMADTGPGGVYVARRDGTHRRYVLGNASRWGGDWWRLDDWQRLS